MPSGQGTQDVAATGGEPSTLTSDPAGTASAPSVLTASMNSVPLGPSRSWYSVARTSSEDSKRTKRISRSSP